MPLKKLVKVRIEGRESAAANRGGRVESFLDRNRVNAKVMKDPRIAGMDPKSMPFDAKRMAYGGFKVLVDA